MSKRKSQGSAQIAARLFGDSHLPQDRPRRINSGPATSRRLAPHELPQLPGIESLRNGNAAMTEIAGTDSPSETRRGSVRTQRISRKR